MLTYEELTPEIMAEYTVIVNCTPVGMFPKVDFCPNIPYELLTPNHLLYDLLYNPNVTLFMKKEKRKALLCQKRPGNAAASSICRLGNLEPVASGMSLRVLMRR